MSNAIVTENQNAGTLNWLKTSTASTQIQAYTDKPSYAPGDLVTFYVSVQTTPITWTGTIFRLGWYGGNGARTIATIPSQTGVAQGYWDQAGLTLNNCPTATTDGTTHLLQPNWASSYTWTIPANATTGWYVAQITDANGFKVSTPFVVRGTGTADYLYVVGDLTSVAYNQWGGYSLYVGPDNTSTTRAYKASFDRPQQPGWGTGNLFQYDLGLIRWLERMGYNVEYCSDIDLHATGASLFNGYSAALFAPHAEYWTYEMRGAVETALTQGVGLGFLGANCVYWQARLEANTQGTANHTVVCYKVLTGSGTDPLSNDPKYGVDNTRVTTQWADALLNRNEVALIGVGYGDVIHSRVNLGWTCDASASTSDPFLKGTGLVPGSTYGTDLVGVEYDHANANDGSPAGRVTLGTTSCQNVSGGADHSSTTYYYAPSGALVFASGSIGWTQALDNYRWRPSSTTWYNGPLEIPELQRLMVNVMAGLVRCKGGTAAATGAGRFGVHG